MKSIVATTSILSYSILWFLLLACHTRVALVSASSSLLDHLPPNVKTLLEQLSHSTEGDEEHQADLWRRLGKTQLDAREYAEARRIFCHGSELCPKDEKLRHHVRVWNAFQGTTDDGDVEETSTTLPKLTVPPPLDVSAASNNPDLFLSFHVPKDAIPLSIQRCKGRVAPGDRCRILHASTEPILSRQACQFLIDSALEAVQKRGWTRDRHVQAPTCDIPVFDLPLSARRWCRHAMNDALLPLLVQTVAPELDMEPHQLHIQDCFLVRYDGTADTGPGFDSLRPHEDESLLSTEYEGGGLYIHSTGDLLNGDAGTVLCFAGQLVHGGYPVTRGTRWIMTVFLYVDANESGMAAGYTLEALKLMQQQQQPTRKGP